MKIQTFLLERFQSIYENSVDYNLGDSGAHPLPLHAILEPQDIKEMLSMPLSYGDTRGSVALREHIGRLYPSATIDNILVTHGTAEANFLATFTLIEPSDEILYVVPNYFQILGLAEVFGAQLKMVSIRPSAEAVNSV